MTDPSIATANAFVKAYWEKMPSSVPSEYSKPSGNPTLIEVSKSLYDFVMSHGDVWLNLNNKEAYLTFDATSLRKE